MIVSDSFIQSSKARDNEFTTADGKCSSYMYLSLKLGMTNKSCLLPEGDRPLVVQFAAHDAKEFADAAELIAPFADGVDLNCGCPQRYVPAVCVVHSLMLGGLFIRIVIKVHGLEIASPPIHPTHTHTTHKVGAGRGLWCPPDQTP